MLTLIEFLEELERSNLAIALPAEEVERLAARFGSQVRSMGRWNHTTDGSVEIPIANITEAVQSLEGHILREAVLELKTPEQFTDLLRSTSAAGQLIEALSRLYLGKFQEKVIRFQESKDAAEANRLGQEVLSTLFGS